MVHEVLGPDGSARPYILDQRRQVVAYVAMDEVVHIPFEEAFPPDSDNDVIGAESSDPYYILESKLSRDGIDAVLGILSEREAYLLRERVGLDGADRTQEDLAKELNISKQRVSGMERKALARLRNIPGIADIINHGIPPRKRPQTESSIPSPQIVFSREDKEILFGSYAVKVEDSLEQILDLEDWQKPSQKFINALVSQLLFYRQQAAGVGITQSEIAYGVGIPQGKVSKILNRDKDFWRGRNSQGETQPGKICAYLLKRMHALSGDRRFLLEDLSPDLKDLINMSRSTQ